MNAQTIAQVLQDLAKEGIFVTNLDVPWPNSEKMQAEKPKPIRRKG